MSERLRLGAAAAVVAVLAGALCLSTRTSHVASTNSTSGVVVAREALAAWGRFAVTGDLGLLGDLFDEGGPQYRRLHNEAPALATDPVGWPPYLFILSDESVTVQLDRETIIGIVTVSRPGEPDQVFNWSIEMRPRDGRWRLWTVRTS